MGISQLVEAIIEILCLLFIRGNATPRALSIKFKKVKSVAYSSQGYHTGQLDF